MNQTEAFAAGLFREGGQAARVKAGVFDLYQDVGGGAKASRPGLKRLMSDARARKFDCLLVWKQDPFGRSLVDCLNYIHTLEDHGIRFLAVTQALGTDHRNPASRLLLHVLAPAAEFERSQVRERTQAGRLRYQQDCKAGKVGRWEGGKTVCSRSGKNLPVGRPKKIFNRERVFELRRQGASLRVIAKQLGVACQISKWGFGLGSAEVSGRGRVSGNRTQRGRA
jgi:DNA invertase Pin-like site-specific DNA recombinase